jgi:2-keto-4-pentenoate hydratase/2-oxohepta-3-ene-1,7-dioic acid hydratase in catechol pathway
MKLVCYRLNGPRGSGGEPRVGALVSNGTAILDFRATIEGAGGDPQAVPVDPIAWMDLDGEWLRRAREIHDSVTEPDVGPDGTKGALIRRQDAKLLAPVPRPGKVICIGLNYRDHAAESNMPIPSSPIVFSKFATAVVGSGEAVLVPETSTQVDYEAELAVVVGRRAKRVPAGKALECVLGYTNFNDVSARDFQFADGQWQRGKSCDTFAPMGEYIATMDEIPDPHCLGIKFRLNGQTMQDSNTDQLIFGVPELIAFLSQTITLEPGDVIATGTPPGVGFARRPPVFIKPGDVMEVEIEGLGVLLNPVAA